MKLRQRPEDFRVDEQSDLDISQKDLEFSLYRLEKTGLDTFTLLAYLSKRLGVPYKEFGVAGLKDRHAITVQNITIPSRYKVTSVNEQNFKLEHIGYLAKAIDIGDLKGNKFEITVRDLRKEDLQGVPERSRDLETQGVPNYFDSQRFGSVIHGEFIARHVIQGDLERAVKVFLTVFTHSEKAAIKKDKKALLDNWVKLENVRPATGILAKVVDVYKTTKDWACAFRAIPHNLRELYMSAYQSYIWNECVKTVIQDKVRRERLFIVRYDLGELIFFKKIEPYELDAIPKTFKTVSHKVDPSPYEGQVLDEVLKREGISFSDLNVKKRTGYFFKVYDREIVVRPGGLKISDPLIDELNDRPAKGGGNRFKVVLSFALQKGSYATIMTKKVFRK